MYQRQQHNNDGPPSLKMQVGGPLSPHTNTNTTPPLLQMRDLDQSESPSINTTLTPSMSQWGLLLLFDYTKWPTFTANTCWWAVSLVASQWTLTLTTNVTGVFSYYLAMTGSNRLGFYIIKLYHIIVIYTQCLKVWSFAFFWQIFKLESYH